MGTFNRRIFLKGSATFLGAGLSAGLTSSCSKQQPSTAAEWKGFHYAMCNESMKDLSWQQQCRIVGGAGFKGIEIAPFTLVQQGVEEITPQKRKEMVTVMNDAGIECQGLHWLLAPPPKGLHFTTPDAAVRKRSIEYLARLIDFSGDLGGTVLTFGSPKQRNAVGISIAEAKKHLADGFAQVADHARQRGVKILIEPLDMSQTDVVNTMAEGMEIVKQVNHPAIQIMFDFHNTPNETEPFDVLIHRHFGNIHHVHVMEMDGTYLGTGNAVNDYVKAFQTLKDLGYQHWVSLEVFDFSPGGEKIANESMGILKQIESKLI
jgi:D-psicose/D-tagatose/L-ribulose 3-epimerase